MCLAGMSASPPSDSSSPVAKEAAPRDTALAVACPWIGKSIPEQGRELALGGSWPRAPVPENAAGARILDMRPIFY